jgi:hypothetical protein
MTNSNFIIPTLSIMAANALSLPTYTLLTCILNNTDIPNYHRAGGPSPDQIFDKIYKENHKESMYADSIFGRRRALRSQPSTTGGGRMGATFAKSGN